jgi:hypothetical protein
MLLQVQHHQAPAAAQQPVESLVLKAPRKTSEQIRREVDYAGVKVSVAVLQCQQAAVTRCCRFYVS